MSESTQSEEFDKEAWNDLVDQISRSASSQYPDVEMEDVSQELWLFLLENRRFETPDTDGATTALWFVGKKAAQKQRTRHLYVSAQYAYRSTDLKKILPSLFNSSDHLNGETTDDSDGSFLDRISTYSDITWAFSQLKAEYRKAIVDRHYHDVRTAPNSAARKTYDRAVNRMADILNTYSREGCTAGPTVRKVFSISQGRHRIDDNYDRQG